MRGVNLTAIPVVRDSGERARAALAAPAGGAADDPDARREVIELDEWRHAVLGMCQAMGFAWDGDDWRAVLAFVGETFARCPAGGAAG
jgi:hypothetical protein